MTKQKLNLNVSDTVDVTLPNKENFRSTIKQIIPRFGRLNGGTTSKGKLIKFSNGKSCDEAWITGIYCKGLHSNYKHNIYKDNKDEKLGWRISTKQKNILCGPFVELCAFYLGKLNEEIITEVSPERFKKYSKSMTGVIEIHKGILITVKKDHFERWFKKNWRKVLYSHKEYDDRLTVHELEYEADYARLMRAEMERDMRRMEKQLDEDLGYKDPLDALDEADMQSDLEERIQL